MPYHQQEEIDSDYPPFDEILEMARLIDQIISQQETLEQIENEFDHLADIHSAFWRILWLSYPSQCYRHLMTMKKSKIPLTSQIDQCIAEIRLIDEYDLYYFEFPFNFDSLNNMIEQLTDVDIATKIEKLFERYKLFDKTHFKKQIPLIKDYSKRLLNDMKQLMYNPNFLTQVKMDSENKFRYYTTLIEDYRDFLVLDMVKRKDKKGLNSLDDLKKRCIGILEGFRKQCEDRDYELMVFSINLAIGFLVEVEDFTHLEIEEIELENLHLQDSETIESVDRAMKTLELYEDQSMIDEYVNSVFPMHDDDDKDEFFDDYHGDEPE